MELSIIIPCFNEAENLQLFLDQIIEFAARNNIKIILVNDGSTDGTRKFLILMQE